MLNYLEEIKKKKHKRKSRYFYRKRFLIGFYAFIMIFILIIFSPIYAGKGNAVSVKDENPSMLTNSKITFVKSEYDKKTKIVKTQFFIGNPQNIDDVTDIQQLTNLNYKVKILTKNKSQKKLKTKIIKVNNNYIVVLTSGVDSNFGILRYDIHPEVINKNMDTNISKNLQMKIYIDNKKVKKSKVTLSLDDDYFSGDYANFIAEKYKKHIMSLEKEIRKSNSIISANMDLIDDLELKKISSVGQAKNDLDGKIYDVKGEINLNKDIIKKNQKEIKLFKEKIEKFR